VGQGPVSSAYVSRLAANCWIRRQGVAVPELSTELRQLRDLGRAVRLLDRLARIGVDEVVCMIDFDVEASAVFASLGRLATRQGCMAVASPRTGVVTCSGEAFCCGHPLSQEEPSMVAPHDQSEFTAGLICDLQRDQHPDLAELPLIEVEGGWGNQMWRLGDELVVRIQRIDNDPDRQLKERRCLLVFAPLLPLPIPRGRHPGGIPPGAACGSARRRTG
jgi:hypothetical protein